MDVSSGEEREIDQSRRETSEEIEERGRVGEGGGREREREREGDRERVSEKVEKEEDYITERETDRR